MKLGKIEYWITHECDSMEIDINIRLNTNSSEVSKVVEDLVQLNTNPKLGFTLLAQRFDRK